MTDRNLPSVWRHVVAYIVVWVVGLFFLAYAVVFLTPSSWSGEYVWLRGAVSFILGGAWGAAISRVSVWRWNEKREANSHE